jgi:Tol biopolymer transport system component
VWCMLNTAPHGRSPLDPSVDHRAALSPTGAVDGASFGSLSISGAEHPARFEVEVCHGPRLQPTPISGQLPRHEGEDLVSDLTTMAIERTGRVLRHPRGRKWSLAAALATAAVALLVPSLPADQLRVQLTSHPADDRCPRWSPDGQLIVFESKRSGTWDLWAVRPDGSGLQRLTDDSGNDRQATWSPAGGRVAFVSDRGGSPDLYLLEVGGRPRRLMAWEGKESQPDWSPDGRRLVFVSDRDGEPRLWTVSVDGGIPRQLTAAPFAAASPRWSPDGSVIACSTRALSDGAEDDVVLLDAEGQAAPVLVTKGPGSATFPVWAPTGETLIWVGSPPGGSAVELALGSLQGKVVSFFGRGFARLTEPDRSPTTGLVVYASSSAGRGFDLWIENVPRR